MHDPWQEFRTRSDWTLRWARLPDDLVGLTDFSGRTVTLDERLLQAERRCTVAHELEHIRRGPMPADSVLAGREEAAVSQAAARKLITLADLAAALCWADTVADAAAELWVDEDTLLERLRHLHPAEVHALRRRLECDRLTCAGCRQARLCAG